VTWVISERSFGCGMKVFSYDKPEIQPEGLEVMTKTKYDDGQEGTNTT
jgi:hypothetical protein